MKRFVASVAVALTLGGYGGCASTESDEGDSGIVVEASISPSCPGPANDLPRCGPEPFSGQLQVADSATGEVVTTLSTDAEGRARTEIAPGSYVIGTPEAALPSADPVTVEVSAGEYREIEISLDSGLR